MTTTPVPGHGWHKSSASNQSNCVEVAFAEGGEAIFVRDSKSPDGAVLTFTPAEWKAFVVGVRRGEFDS